MIKDVALQLVGGPLDGVFLPITPEATIPPRQLLVFAPLNATWASYRDFKRRTGAVDVYKIRVGARLMVNKPDAMKIVDMRYEGMVPPEMARRIESMARNREA